MKRVLLFGKWYMWVVIMGRLELRPAVDWDMQPRKLAAPTFAELMAELGRIEAQGGE